jgi:hypothetical protein
MNEDVQLRSWDFTNPLENIYLLFLYLNYELVIME